MSYNQNEKWKRVWGSCPKNKFEGHGVNYKTVVSPAMVYDAESWAVNKAHENKLDVSEINNIIRS